MKKLIAAIVLTTAALAGPALALDVGVTIRVGEPGFYGQIDIGDTFRPRVIYAEPVLVVRRYRNLAPIYLRVPPGHARNWSKHCDRYNACTRPVYFVRDDWYNDVYVPGYARSKAQDRREDRREDRRDDRQDDRRDDKRKDR